MIPRCTMKYWIGLVAIGTSSLYALFAFALEGTFTRFMADDYCSAALVRSVGIFTATSQVYNTWSGRFSATFLDSMAGLLEPSFSPYSPIVVIAIWVAVLAGTLYKIGFIHRRMSRLVVAFLLSITILFALLATTPDRPLSVYWGQGMRSVVPPLILLTALIGIFAHYQKQMPNQISLPPILVVGVLAFVAGGFSETGVVLQITLICFALLVVTNGTLSVRRNVVWVALAALLGSLVAVVMVISAPGNKLRQAFFPPSPDPLSLLWITGWSTANFLRYNVLAGWFSYRGELRLQHAMAFLMLLSTAILVGIISARESVSDMKVPNRVFVAFPLERIPF